MKRLVCILYGLTAGGAETFLMKICRTLPVEEYRIDFIVSESGGCYECEVLDRGCLIHRIPKRTEDPLGALDGIKKIVSEHNYQYVIKLGDNPIASLDLIAARMGGAKRLAMRSCNALTGLSAKERCVNAVLRPVLNRVANVKLAPSMLAAEFTFGKHHAHKDVHLLHNGVDLNVFRFDPVARQKIREEFAVADKLVVGHIGRFHKQKNHRYLLEVFRAIKEKREDVLLLLVGTGELEAQIREWVEELGLKGSVVLTGQRFDVPQLLSAMDVFVFPSLHEGMPNTVIEAQATGLPCVIADTITPEADITGLVTYLPLEDPDVWAQCALSAAGNTRINTHDHFIANKYDIQSVAEHFVELILSDT